MAKFNVEFKGTISDENGSETRQFRKVVEASALAALITAHASDPGIELLTVRKVFEPKPKVMPAPAKVEVKK